MSLEQCKYTGDKMDDCADMLKTRIPVWFGESTLSSICFVYLLMKSRYTAAVGVANYVFIFFYKTGYNVKGKLFITNFKTNLTPNIDHGGLNRLYVAIAVTIMISGYYGVMGFRRLYNKHKKIFM